MLAADEINLGKRIYCGVGYCGGPKYGEVYEIDEPGSHPGFVVVTRSTADQSLFVGHKLYQSLPGKVTIEQAREAAENDAWHRNEGK